MGIPETFKRTQLDLGRSADERTLGAVSTARSCDTAQEDDHEGERGYYPRSPGQSRLLPSFKKSYDFEHPPQDPGEGFEGIQLPAVHEVETAHATISSSRAAAGRRGSGERQANAPAVQAASERSTERGGPRQPEHPRQEHATAERQRHSGMSIAADPSYNDDVSRTHKMAWLRTLAMTPLSGE